MTDPLDEDQQELLAVIGAFLKRILETSLTVDMQAEAEATSAHIIQIGLKVIRREWSRVKRLD